MVDGTPSGAPGPSPSPSASRGPTDAAPPPKWPPDPSPQPAAPALHNATAAEIAAAKADNDKGVVHGSESKGKTDRTMDQLLPEKPVIKDGKAQLGNLTVEADKYPQFREAMMHESKNPEMNALVERLEKGPYKTNVTTNEVSNNEMEPQMNGNAEVHWDPKHMHVASNDAKRSPATRLAHELDHADEWTHNPQRLITNANTPDDKFSNLEEKRVITGSERRNVKAIGEGQREDHSAGKGEFNSKGVTSAVPVLHQTRGGVTTELADGYNQTGKISVDGDNIKQDIGRGQSVNYPRAEFEGLVGKNAVDQAVAGGKPVTVAVQGGEFKMQEPRAVAQEVQHSGR